MKVTRHEIMQRARAILAECRALVPDQAAKLDRITFKVSARMTRAAGNARPLTGEIKLSLPFFADRANFDADFRNTVTHEIAHVLAPSFREYPGQRRNPHGPAWRAMHRRLGGTGDRCHTLELADGYTARRSRRVSVPCPCGCGQDMKLGPTQAKRHREHGGTFYYLRGHRPKRRGDGMDDLLRNLFR